VDGYHDINTLFAGIDLADQIILRPAPDGEIHCAVRGNRMLDGGSDNLCVRAAGMMRRSRGITAGVEIELVKNVPIGAGLGGGSSDAATVMRGVERLWGIRLHDREREEIALALGSDVPFFLKGGIAHATGQGEKLLPLAIVPDYSILLLNPGIHIPTPWAYRAIDRRSERPASDMVESLRRGIEDPGLLRKLLVNDFEPVVFAAHPLLGDLKQRLYDAGALFALMSGSGSTMFGLFESRQRAESAQALFASEWTFISRFTPPL
jgi:4-diphosphocytidyl-2-C-methyl-D-erythritol kinase